MIATRCRQVRSEGFGGFRRVGGGPGRAARYQGEPRPLGIGAPGRNGAQGAAGVSTRCLWHVPGGFLRSAGCFQLNRNCIPLPSSSRRFPAVPSGLLPQEGSVFAGDPELGSRGRGAAPCAGRLFAGWGGGHMEPEQYLCAVRGFLSPAMRARGKESFSGAAVPVLECGAGRCSVKPPRGRERAAAFPKSRLAAAEGHKPAALMGDSAPRASPRAAGGC